MSQTPCISCWFHSRFFQGSDFVAVLSLPVISGCKISWESVCLACSVVNIVRLYSKAKKWDYCYFCHSPVVVNMGKPKEDHATNHSPTFLLSLNSISWCHGWRWSADLNGSLCPDGHCRSRTAEIFCSIGLTL